MAISNPSGNYIDKITLPSGSVYTIVDADARATIDTMAKYTQFLGVTTTALTDNTTTTAVVTIGGNSVTATTGSIVIYNGGEFIYDGTKWQLFGDISAQTLGELAYYDSATGTYQPAGTITLTSSTVTASGGYKPAGTVALTSSTTTLKITNTSTAPSGSATATYWTYKPTGTVTVTPSRTTTTTAVLSGVTGNNVMTSLGTSAPATATPNGGVNYTAVSNHNLNLYYLVSSTANAISGRTTASVVTDVTVSNTSSFNGTTIYVPPIATLTIPTGASFEGTSATITVNSGTKKFATAASFTGTTATITVQRTT